MKRLLIAICLASLTACALTPEQHAAREAKRVRAEQALQIALAKQCDVETADLMYQQFNPPLTVRNDKAQKAFEQRYAEKVNNPMFQACYKLAWQNYKNQEEIRRLQYDVTRDYGFWGYGRCFSCW